MKSTEIASCIEVVLDGCLDWMNGLKKKKKVKIGTYSETDCDCLNPECCPDSGQCFHILEVLVANLKIGKTIGGGVTNVLYLNSG